MVSVRYLLLDTEQGPPCHGGAELLERWRASDTATLWVDIDGIPGDREAGLLTKRFGINSFTLADIRPTPQQIRRQGLGQFGWRDWHYLGSGQVLVHGLNLLGGEQRQLIHRLNDSRLQPRNQRPGHIQLAFGLSNA